MVRTFVALVVLGSFVGCGVGDSAPDSDNRNDQLGIVCSATFTTTGAFVVDTSAMRPEGDTGCWPVGTWTFTAALDQNDCASPSTVLPEYKFRVVRTSDENGPMNTPMWLGTAAVHKVGVSGTGAGCQGSVELFSADSKQYWNMRPFLRNDGTALEGNGTYTLYNSPQL